MLGSCWAYTQMLADFFTFCKRNLIPIVSSAAGMRIASGVHPQADKTSFIFLHSTCDSSGKAGTQSQLSNQVPPKEPRHTLKRDPSQMDVSCSDSVPQDSYLIFTGVWSLMSCRSRTLFKWMILQVLFKIKYIWGNLAMLGDKYQRREVKFIT